MDTILDFAMFHLPGRPGTFCASGPERTRASAPLRSSLDQHYDPTTKWHGAVLHDAREGDARIPHGQNCRAAPACVVWLASPVLVRLRWRHHRGGRRKDAAVRVEREVSPRGAYSKAVHRVPSRRRPPLNQRRYVWYSACPAVALNLWPRPRRAAPLAPRTFHTFDSCIHTDLLTPGGAGVSGEKSCEK